MNYVTRYIRVFRLWIVSFNVKRMMMCYVITIKYQHPPSQSLRALCSTGQSHHARGQARRVHFMHVGVAYRFCRCRLLDTPDVNGCGWH